LSTFQLSTLSKICDTLFTQTSFDLSHLVFLEQLLFHFPLDTRLLKATLSQVNTTAQLRIACIAHALAEIEVLEAEEEREKEEGVVSEVMDELSEN